MRNKGFTLIELIVVIVIFGVLATWFTNNYFYQQEQQNLVEATTTVRSFIDNIRQSSLLGLTPTDDADLTLFAGYGVSVNINDNEISKVYVYNSISNTEQILSIKKFKNINLVAIEPVGVTTVLFTPNKSTLERTDGIELSSYKIVLENSITEECASISINGQGVIITNDEEICPET